MGGALSSMPEQSTIESVGANYDAAMMLVAREKTRRAMHEIAAAIRPGMLEEEAMEFTRASLKDAGLLRGWHGIHVRFGPNTLKSFGVPSDPGVRLQADDVFFLDIGPVWQRCEADAGATYVVGSDPEMLRIARDVKTVFTDVAARWRSDGLTGRDLYAYAAERASALGWQLNLDMTGHRLSDFPHSAFHKGPLADVPFKPTSGLWVLEIQIRHPGRPFGAFFEDLLHDADGR
jgi:Xaa-Pro aminopeptidase